MTRAEALLLLAALLPIASCAPDAFVEVHDFGDNPGALRMFEHVPTAEVDGERALVVFLHGCNQTHDAARTAGLVRIADERGVHVVAPEQGAFNNGNVCFNWFDRADTGRDSGEAASIRAMIGRSVDVHAIDATRIFVAGLSAGAAMVSSLLAAYPDVFAAGAALAGGPAGCARSVLDAPSCMSDPPSLSGDEWAERVRDIAPDGAERTAWPRLLAMHGAEDAVVSPSCTDATVAQWAALHGIDASEPAITETIPAGVPGNATRDVFGDGEVERILIDNLGHALPIDPTSGCGEDAPFQEDIELCAVDFIAQFFAL